MEITIGMKGEVSTLVEREDTAAEVGSLHGELMAVALIQLGNELVSLRHGGGAHHLLVGQLPPEADVVHDGSRKEKIILHSRIRSSRRKR